MKDKILYEIARTDRANSKLIDFLCQSDFFTAPASTKYHLARPGGLAQHSWNVYRELSRLHMDYCPDIGEDSIIITALLHDICKANFYGTDTKNVKDEFGKWSKVPYITVKDLEPLGHGEKSVIVIQRFIPLSIDEQLAIRWHMGGWDSTDAMSRKSLNQAVEICALLRALLLADQMVTFKES